MCDTPTSEVLGLVRERLGPDAEPEFAVQTFYDTDGNIGETWLLVAKGTLIVLSKSLGRDFEITTFPLSKITGIEIEAAAFGGGTLAIISGKRVLTRLHFSGLDRDRFERIDERIENLLNLEKSRAGTATATAETLEATAPLRIPPKRPPRAPAPEHSLEEVPEKAAISKAKAAEDKPEAPGILLDESFVMEATSRVLEPSARPSFVERPSLKNVAEKQALFSDAKIAIALQKETFRPGDTIEGRVDLYWPSRKKVRGIRARLTGKETTSITVSSGNSSTTYREENVITATEITLWGFPRGQEEAEALFLEEGSYHHDFFFTLPCDCLPSYKGYNAKVEYEIMTYVDIPMRFDLKVRAPITVREEELFLLDAIGKTEKDKITLEAWSERCHWKQGAPLTVGFSFTNPQGKTIRGAVVRIASEEFARASRQTRTLEKTLLEKSIYQEHLPASGEATTISFILPEVPQPYEGVYSHVRVFVEVSLDMPWAKDIRVKLPLSREGRRP